MESSSFDKNDASELTSYTPQKRPLPPSPSTGLASLDHQSNRTNGLLPLTNSAADGEPTDTTKASYRRYKPKGLNNLGNTCFMNSALQCLAATVPLTKYLISGAWEKEINATNPLGSGGDFARVFAELVSSMWRADGLAAIAPRDFKYMIGTKNPLFIGYGQQDSQELAIFLLDGLHEDLNRIANPGFVKDPDYDISITDFDFAKLCWDAYLKRNDSIIVDLFQGQLKSRLECTVCGNISVKCDASMYLSVPIPETRTVTISIVAVGNTYQMSEMLLKSLDSLAQSAAVSEAGSDDASHFKAQEVVVSFLKKARSQYLHLTFPRDATIANAKHKIISQLGWKQNSRVHCFEVFRSSIYTVFQDTDTVATFGKNDEIYFYQEEPVEYLTNHPVLSQIVLGGGLDTATIHVSMVAVDYRENPFGAPLVLTLPATLSLAGSHAEKQSQQIIGSCVYNQSVDTLSRYSSVPLFRRKRSGITIAVVSKESDWADKFGNDLSFYRISDEWEAIPDLFTITMNKKVIYPAENDAETDNGTAHSLEMSLHSSSPKSELSELTFRMEEKGTIHSEIGSHQDLVPLNGSAHGEEPTQVSASLLSSMKFSIQITKDLAEAMFGRISMYGGVQAFEPAGDKLPPVAASSAAPITLDECMKEFEKEELLAGVDTFYCGKCKEHQETKKRLEVYKLSEILIIHLKRFTSTRYGTTNKKTEYVDAPRVLNMAPYLHDTGVAQKYIYDLYAVSNHFGGLGGGHYTAFVLNPLDGKWLNCDDSQVSVTGENIISPASYILFYQRRGTTVHNFAEIIEAANMKRGEIAEREAYLSASRNAAPSEPKPKMPDPLEGSVGGLESDW
ncbi:CSN-associated deubiquitinating enzyme Ubp12 [Kappamyces sp. JEL0829]|nr:CSN-associated deubiquitinating enzyme Ubp12 [Kappamyces sp. JEL0829]